jgi:hypothetical protein
MDNKIISETIKDILESLKYEYPNENIKLEGMIKYIVNIEEEKRLQDACTFCRTQESIEGEEDSRSKFFINRDNEFCFEGTVDIYEDMYKNHISDYEDKEDYIKIEYCPKCGRKLR